MTKPVPISATQPTDLRAAFGCHAVPFTREIATDHHLRLPFLDEALAGLLAAVEARMPAALVAPAGTGKTALLRRLRVGLPDARYHVAPVVGPDGGFPQTPTRSSTTKGRSR